MYVQDEMVLTLSSIDTILYGSHAILLRGKMNEKRRCFFTMHI